MASFNSVTLMGNLTRDPELKTLPDGTELCEFTLAVNEKYKGSETVSFIDCVVWKELAENLTVYKKKGDSILIQGKLRQETWNDKDSGQKRSKIKVTVFSVTFVGGKSEPKADNASYGGNDKGYSDYATKMPDDDTGF